MRDSGDEELIADHLSRYAMIHEPCAQKKEKTAARDQKRW